MRLTTQKTYRFNTTMIVEVGPAELREEIQIGTDGASDLIEDLRVVADILEAATVPPAKPKEQPHG